MKIDIMPLTEFAAAESAPQGNEGPSKLKVYLSILDAFDCQIKTPAVFRFELYDKIPRSAEPKGRRIFIWPDIDLTDAAKNNDYWKDFLRAYEFDLPLQRKPAQTCILEVTAMCPQGKRLSAEFILK